jgi:hypothetical protein
MDMPPPPGSDDPIGAFANAADQLRLIVEMVAGYKRQLMEAGFSEDAAESMAVILHGEIAHKIFHG